MTTISLDDMRSSLLTVDQLHDRLAQFEPLTRLPFTIGDEISFSAATGWNHGLDTKLGDEPIAVWARLGFGQSSIQLTKDTLDQLARRPKLGTAYEGSPADLLIHNLNYWYRDGLMSSRKNHDLQFMVNANGLAVNLTEQRMLPVSNLALLDQALTAIRHRFGPNTEVLADYKLGHSYRQTAMRLIITDSVRELLDTGTDEDFWAFGLQLKNSLTGVGQTSIEGYCFRFVCTNGQIDTHSSSGAWTRRKDSTEAEVYAWARSAVDDVLGGLEASLDRIQALTSVDIDGLTSALDGVFRHYRIPASNRTKIIDNLSQYPGKITMYVIMNAITEVANSQNLEDSSVESLMRIGGDLTYTGDHLCGACHQLVGMH